MCSVRTQAYCTRMPCIVSCECTLTAGEFGVVYKGHLLKDLGQTVIGIVAIKTLKGLVQRLIKPNRVVNYK